MDNPEMGMPFSALTGMGKPIPGAYGAIDSDLARDNLDNDFDLSPADAADVDRRYPDDENRPL